MRILYINIYIYLYWLDDHSAHDALYTIFVFILPVQLGWSPSNRQIWIFRLCEIIFLYFSFLLGYSHIYLYTILCTNGIICLYNTRYSQCLLFKRWIGVGKWGCRLCVCISGNNGRTEVTEVQQWRSDLYSTFQMSIHFFISWYQNSLFIYCCHAIQKWMNPLRCFLLCRKCLYIFLALVSFHFTAITAGMRPTRKETRNDFSLSGMVQPWIIDLTESCSDDC